MTLVTSDRGCARCPT